MKRRANVNVKVHEPAPLATAVARALRVRSKPALEERTLTRRGRIIARGYERLKR